MLPTHLEEVNRASFKEARPVASSDRGRNHETLCGRLRSSVDSIRGRFASSVNSICSVVSPRRWRFRPWGNTMLHLRTISSWKQTLRYVLATLVGCSFKTNLELTASQALLSGWLVLQLLGGWRFTKVVFLTLKRDAIGLYVLLKVKYMLNKNIKEKQNIPSLFRQNVLKHPHKSCFLFEDQVWTFQDVYHFSNRVSNYFQKEGFSKGDVVALFMESRPEFVGFWLGLAAIGVETALINYNLRTDSLAHAANVVSSKALIFSSNLSSAVDEALRGAHLPHSMRLYSYSTKPQAGSNVPSSSSTESPESTETLRFVTESHVTPLEEALRKSSTLPPLNPPSVEFTDVMLYIFTSGTTGLPKAAVIKHQRYFLFAYGITISFSILPEDIVYGCLPLYHTAGNNLGVGTALIQGCTVVLRKKFSASQFWKDCCRYRVTVIQYIGEICRYLLAQPSSPYESEHKVRLAIGNGLRPQIWKNFQTRFHVDLIGEFYGSTEGNTNIVNMTFRQGCVGFTTRIMPALHPVSLVKVDEETESVVRGPDGLCMHCQPGEPGQLVGRIPPKDRFLQFDGYANQQATKKKIVFDVWKKGDMAFLSGDILVMDELGFMYFKDRTGDTFRWKGENVSTAEVEGIIMQILGLRDVVVYGVAVPGTEGKAGMAAIHVDLSGGGASGDAGVGGCGDVSYPDLDNLVNEMKTKLPSYAQPLFIRFASAIDATGTFKFKKNSLREEGYNPDKISDSIFVFDANSSKYIPLDRRIYDQILSGVVRL